MFLIMSDKNNENDDEDDALWTEITKDVSKIEHVRSLVDDPAQSVDKTRTPVKKPKKTATSGEKAERSRPEIPDKDLNPGLDRKTSDRLRKGQLPIDGILDLHGMTRVNAHEALNRFIQNGYVQGKRCILVITGKGAGADGRRDPLNQGQGVLKQSVPQWLNEPPNKALVLQSARAKPHHGGDGALYVLLRRKR